MEGLRQFEGLADSLNEASLELLSFEILPSSFSFPNEENNAPILRDGTAVAIRKSDLVRAFCCARLCLLYEASRANGFDNPSVLPCPKALEAHDARIAAWIVLIFDPEHLTAANYLRRCLEKTLCPKRADLLAELRLLQSVLTSPLHKHSKSPTLWSYRFWIMASFYPWIEDLGADNNPSSNVESSLSKSDFSHHDENLANGICANFWAAEIEIALKAAEQHDKNYHAFNYLRSTYTLMRNAKGVKVTSSEWSQILVKVAERLTEWCLQHPRDISGFSFLGWFLCTISKDSADSAIAKDAVRAVQSFKSNLQWNGKSVDVFLEMVVNLVPV